MKILALVFLAAAAAIAQTPPTCNTATIPACSFVQGSGDVQTKPAAVPTSTTIVAASDAFLKSITVSNPTAGSITFSLCDRQASPVCLLPAVSIAANTTYVISWLDGRLYWTPGGFTVLAGGAGLTVQAGYRQ